MEKELKINLGCGSRLLPGYVNVDKAKYPIRYLPDYTPPHTYLQADVMELDKWFPAESATEIRSEFLFEHLTHQQITKLLFKIWNVLERRGVLIIIVPDFEAMIDYYDSKQKRGEFNDADIMHYRFFSTEDETLHRSVWYPTIGTWYLTREGLFADPAIAALDESTIEFKTRKI